MSITVIATGFDAGLVGSDPMDVPQNASAFTRQGAAGSIPKRHRARGPGAAGAARCSHAAGAAAPAVEEDDNSYFDDDLGLLNNRGNN